MSGKKVEDTVVGITKRNHRAKLPLGLSADNPGAPATHEVDCAIVLEAGLGSLKDRVRASGIDPDDKGQAMQVAMWASDNVPGVDPLQFVRLLSAMEQRASALVSDLS